MKALGIRPALRRQSKLVGLGVLAALASAFLTTHRVSITPPQIQARETGSGLAGVQVLVDTPRSLIAAFRASPCELSNGGCARWTGEDTIVARSTLLGSLLASDDVRMQIAQEAAVQASELAVVNPYLGSPVVATPLSRAAAGVAPPNAPNVVSVSAEDPRVPILSVLATAPKTETASRLARSATTALVSLGNSDASGSRAVDIRQLGPARVERVLTGVSGAKVALVAVVALALWCAAVVLFDWVARRRTAVATPAIGRAATMPGSPRSGSRTDPQGLNGGAPDRFG
jgi:hypothetical protein